MPSTNDSHKNLEKIDILIAKGKKSVLSDIIKEKTNKRLSYFIREAIYEYMVEMDSDNPPPIDYVIKFGTDMQIVVDTSLDAATRKKLMEQRLMTYATLLSAYSDSNSNEIDAKKRKYEYIANYHKEKYESIRVWFPKGDKEFIKEHADRIHTSYSEFAIHATLWLLKKRHDVTVDDTIVEKKEM